MLYSLHVKNLALIKEQEIEFSKGLNILTGETGAGKSVVIGSVNLALGAKADPSLIRTGEEYALVELVFGVENDHQRKLLEGYETVFSDPVFLSRDAYPVILYRSDDREEDGRMLTPYLGIRLPDIFFSINT